MYLGKGHAFSKSRSSVGRVRSKVGGAGIAAAGTSGIGGVGDRVVCCGWLRTRRGRGQHVLLAVITDEVLDARLIQPLPALVERVVDVLPLTGLKITRVPYGQTGQQSV